MGKRKRSEIGEVTNVDPKDNRAVVCAYSSGYFLAMKRMKAIMENAPLDDGLLKKLEASTRKNGIGEVEAASRVLKFVADTSYKTALCSFEQISDTEIRKIREEIDRVKG